MLFWFSVFCICIGALGWSSIIYIGKTALPDLSQFKYILFLLLVFPFFSVSIFYLVVSVALSTGLD